MRLVHGTSQVTGQPFVVGDAEKAHGSSEFVRGDPPIALGRAPGMQWSTAADRAYLKGLVKAALVRQNSPLANDDGCVSAVADRLTDLEGVDDDVRRCKIGLIGQLRQFDPLSPPAKTPKENDPKVG